ncbi:MAG: tetratricopeptide repeat protein, partial [Lachnospiraceae bacterium]|nr:tetratricopeptide repeat protein [Lachnospiraceae bacterium]
VSFENPKQYIKLARLYRALKDYDKALEWIQRAINSDMCFGCGYACCEEGYYELGITYQFMGELAKAKEAFEKAIEVHGHCGIYDIKLAECIEK